VRQAQLAQVERPVEQLLHVHGRSVRKGRKDGRTAVDLGERRRPCVRRLQARQHAQEAPPPRVLHAASFVSCTTSQNPARSSPGLAFLTCQVEKLRSHSSSFGSGCSVSR